MYTPSPHDRDADGHRINPIPPEWGTEEYRIELHRKMARLKGEDSWAVHIRWWMTIGVIILLVFAATERC